MRAASGLLVVLCIVGAAQADRLRVEIDIFGSEAFSEGEAASGSIRWIAAEPLTITEGPFEFSISFRYNDPDNVLIDPVVSDLSLVDWPEAYGTSISSWGFIWMSSSVGGPRNSWSWSADMTIDGADPLPVFAAGQVIATATFSTGGDDIDDIADDSGFTLSARATKRVWVSQSIPGSPGSGFWGASYHGADEVVLNPEPVPEPATAALCLLGAMSLVRKSHRRR